MKLLNLLTNQRLRTKENRVKPIKSREELTKPTLISKAFSKEEDDFLFI